MISGYWNKTKISAKKSEKLELYHYEVRMFRETCDKWETERQKWLKGFKRNLLIESIAVHARVLIDFFYSNKKKHSNDLIAQDFLKKVVWKKERPEITEILEFAKSKADKQLAHLSLWRIKLKKDGNAGWSFSKIQKDMNVVINKFEEYLNN